MAAPRDLTTLDISGKWTLNRKLSDPMDDILRLQGIGVLKRTAMGMGTAHLTVKHYKDDQFIEHIEIGQKYGGDGDSNGKIPGSKDIRILDGEDRRFEDYLIGPVVGNSRRASIDELESEFLQSDWEGDVRRHGVIASSMRGDTNKGTKEWISDLAWGFENVKGVRRYTRRISFTGPKGEKHYARLVYDYKGPLTESDEDEF
ncbi:Pericyclase pydY-like protein [Abortiporus biennis]